MTGAMSNVARRHFAGSIAGIIARIDASLSPKNGQVTGFPNCFVERKGVTDVKTVT
jgi:hypothetical protein